MLCYSILLLQIQPEEEARSNRSASGRRHEQKARLHLRRSPREKLKRRSSLALAGKPDELFFVCLPPTLVSNCHHPWLAENSLREHFQTIVPSSWRTPASFKIICFTIRLLQLSPVNLQNALFFNSFAANQPRQPSNCFVLLYFG